MAKKRDNREKRVSLKEYVASCGGASYKVLYSIYREVVEGRVKLVDPSPPRSFYEYLVRLDYSLWFWVVVVLVFLTLLSIALTNVLEGIIYLRYVLGSIYVLFLPGYVTIEALYPLKRELSPLERLALSIGLSLALVPLMGLVLNYTPWGIRLEPILVSMSIYILFVSIVAAYRKYVFISRH